MTKPKGLVLKSMARMAVSKSGTGSMTNKMARVMSHGKMGLNMKAPI